MKVSKRAAVVAAIVAAAGVSVPTFAAQHSPAGGTGSNVACDDGTLSWTPSNLWPPNHKFVPIHISYTENSGDSDGDSTAIMVTQVTEKDGANAPQDATVAETMNGSGQPGQIDAQPDANYPATTGSDTTAATYTEDLRAERSGTDGHGSGRTYTLTVQCMDTGGTDMMEPNGDTAQITVTVPHDQGVVKQ